MVWPLLYERGAGERIYVHQVALLSFHIRKRQIKVMLFVHSVIYKSFAS